MTEPTRRGFLNVSKVVTIEQMRALERDAGALGLPGPALMENAGRSVADVIVSRYDPSTVGHALVLVGPGNNGGDGLVTARHLHDAGFRVVVYLVSRPSAEDAKVLLLQERGVPILDLADDLGLARLDAALDQSDLVVDAVLGTGRARPIAGSLADILDKVNQRSPRPVVVALDLPTGVNADTGEADPHAVIADLTITLGHAKRGLLLGAAIDHVGDLVVADIGIPATVSSTIPIDYADDALIAPLLPRRPRGSHKGLFGRVVAVAGSAQYTGAPVLAALGAERIGAGLVTLACPDSVRDSLAAHTVETTFLPLPDNGTGELGPTSLEPLVAALDSYAAILIGPGIGRSPTTRAFLDQLLTRLDGSSRPLVIDADALTILSEWPNWWARLPRHSILTPHPGEMARLNTSTADGDRISRSIAAARTWNAVVVAKGAYTVVAKTNDRGTVLPFALPSLATAGTGDVLAGAILGLLGQGLTPEDAALAGAYLHGLAGAMLQREVGPAGGLAADLVRYLPKALESVRRKRPTELPGRR